MMEDFPMNPMRDMAFNEFEERYLAKQRQREINQAGGAAMDLDEDQQLQQAIANSIQQHGDQGSQIPAIVAAADNLPACRHPFVRRLRVGVQYWCWSCHQLNGITSERFQCQGHQARQCGVLLCRDCVLARRNLPQCDHEGFLSRVNPLIRCDTCYRDGNVSMVGCHRCPLRLCEMCARNY